MIIHIEKRHTTLGYKILRSFIAVTFLSSVVLPPGIASAQFTPTTVLDLPVPGTMLPPSPGFMPVLMTGLTIHPENPLRFDFIMDTGHSGLDIDSDEFKKESEKLIKYFMASLTTPENELWVNLSPYEKDRMIPHGLGDTEMGRDMLAQDYLLKQLTASLMYPEQELGKEFWKRVYQKAREKFGTTEIPLNTFNKIWIVPEDALVYEQNGSAFVIHSKLAVMLEEDYAALRQSKNTAELTADDTVVSGLQSQVVREVLIPEITKEINEGKNFANLRQIFNALILATWYKVRLRESLLGKVYLDQSKTKGIDSKDKQINEKIYTQYLEAFKKGVYNYIREDYDESTQQIIPRKYFSGGVSAARMRNGKWFSQFLVTGGLVLGLTAFSALPSSAREEGKNVLAGVGNQAGVTAEFVENSPDDLTVTVHNGKNVRPVLLAQAAEAARLREDLKNPHWETQKRAAQELYRRVDEDGIDLARQILVWPRIRKMTGSRIWGKPYGNGEEGNELIELGEIAEQPLLENLQNKKSEINTRKWSAHLLGIIGRFDKVFPVLHGILDSKEHFLSYMPADHYNALEIETLNGIRKLLDRQSLHDLLNVFVLYEERNPAVIRWILSSLGNFPEEKAIRALIPFFNRDGEYVAYSALDSADRILTKNAEFVALIPVEEVVKSMYFEGSTVAHLAQGRAVRLLVTVFNITKNEKIVKELIERLAESDIHPGLKFDIELSLEKLAKSGSKEAIQYLKGKQSWHPAGAPSASTLNFPDATVRIEGSPVDPAGVKFEGDVYIYNNAGQPIKLSEQAGQFFQETPEGKLLVKDTVIVIKPSADAVTAASPIASSPIGRKLTKTVLALAAAGIICLSGCGGPGSKTPEPPPPTKDFNVNAAVTWMYDQINPETNLIRSFQDLPSSDPSYGVTWIYNQAQAMEGFLAAGEVSKAKRLADGLLALQGADGAWFNAYVTDTGSVATNLFEQYTRWVGPNVVVGRALVDVSEATGDGRYTEAAMKLTGWLDKYFVDRGSYGYLTGGVGVPWTSTEHNMRAMAFYDRVGDKPRADLIAAWINTRMFAGDHYYVGYSFGETVNTDPTMATDVQYLGPLMALHGGRDPQIFAGGIDWLLEHQTAIVLDNQGLVGIPRWLNVGNSLWFEGIGELVGALQVLGREEEIDKFLSSIKMVQRSDGSLPAAIGGTSGWPGDFPYSSVEAVGSDIAAVLGDPRHMAKPLPLAGANEQSVPEIELRAEPPGASSPVEDQIEEITSKRAEELWRKSDMAHYYPRPGPEKRWIRSYIWGVAEILGLDLTQSRDRKAIASIFDEAVNMEKLLNVDSALISAGAYEEHYLTKAEMLDVLLGKKVPRRYGDRTFRIMEEVQEGVYKFREDFFNKENLGANHELQLDIFEKAFSRSKAREKIIEIGRRRGVQMNGRQLTKARFESALKKWDESVERYEATAEGARPYHYFEIISLYYADQHLTVHKVTQWHREGWFLNKRYFIQRGNHVDYPVAKLIELYNARSSASSPMKQEVRLRLKDDGYAHLGPDSQGVMWANQALDLSDSSTQENILQLFRLAGLDSSWKGQQLSLIMGEKTVGDQKVFTVPAMAVDNGQNIKFIQFLSRPFDYDYYMGLISTRLMRHVFFDGDIFYVVAKVKFDTLPSGGVDFVIQPLESVSSPVAFEDFQEYRERLIKNIREGRYDTFMDLGQMFWELGELAIVTLDDQEVVKLLEREARPGSGTAHGAREAARKALEKIKSRSEKQEEKRRIQGEIQELMAKIKDPGAWDMSLDLGRLLSELGDIAAANPDIMKSEVMKLLKWEVEFGYTYGVKKAAENAIIRIERKSASSPVGENRGQGTGYRVQEIASDEGRTTSDEIQTTKEVGGIDLNPALLDLQIRRDGNGVPLPLPMQPVGTMKIDGFIPVIINIVPITNLPFLLGLDLPQEEEKPVQLTYQELSLAVTPVRERFHPDAPAAS